MTGLGRKLVRDVAVYGVGDVATSVVNLLLLPLYTDILTPADYGVMALLLTIEAGAKILLRWGVDAAFMRLYYDCRDDAARQTLASTTWLFLAAVNAPVFVAAYWFAPSLGELMFDTTAHTATLRVFLVNTFVIGFYFIPFHVYRIEGRTSRFVALTFSRAAGTVVLRLLLVAVLGMGVFGMVAADLILTAIIGAALTPTFAALFRPRFSTALVKDALHFGLPRVPHGVAHQATALADRWILNKFMGPDVVGIYSVGVSIGLGMKLFLSAFEYAWAPFYLDAMKHPEAKALYSRTTTYVVAILALLATGLAATSNDLVRLMTAEEFHGAGVVVPWIAIGVLCQGFFQLTAIGLNITKRTRTLPAATGAAMAVAIGVNTLLVPRYGMIAAAWTYAMSYATLAAVGFALSQRVYPVQYEWSRLLRVALAGAAAYGLSISLVPAAWPLVVRLLLHGLIVLAAYPAGLAALKFFRPGELAGLLRLREFMQPPSRQSAAGEELELGGEIASAPSVVDAAGADRAASRKVE